MSIPYTTDGYFEYTRDTSGDGKTIFAETTGANPSLGDLIFFDPSPFFPNLILTDDATPGFQIGQDLTGQDNNFFGTINGSVNGSPTEFLIATGSDEVPPGSGNFVADNNGFLVLLPDGGDPNDVVLPRTFNVDVDLNTSTYFCFAEGTLIATETGETVVERLQIGDPVRTEDGRIVPVKWIGRQAVNKLFAGSRMEPVRIRAGALGGGLPHNDLTVTADHGMIVDGLVINASALVNGGSIDWVPLDELPDRVTYYHVETEDHDVILANGAPAETFIDIPGRVAFDNYQEYLDLYGAERIIPEMGRPRISARRLVPDAIKARLGTSDASFDFDFDEVLRA